MIKLNKMVLASAIERAKALRPTVRFIRERQFAVVSPTSGNHYEVSFQVIDKGKFGSCTCKAGQNGRACYHLASAASLNIGIQAMRLQVSA